MATDTPAPRGAAEPSERASVDEIARQMRAYIGADSCPPIVQGPLYVATAQLARWHLDAMRARASDPAREEARAGGDDGELQETAEPREVGTPPVHAARPEAGEAVGLPAHGQGVVQEGRASPGVERNVDWKERARAYALLYSASQLAVNRKDRELKRVTKRWVDADNNQKDLWRQLQEARALSRRDPAREEGR